MMSRQRCVSAGVARTAASASTSLGAGLQIVV
jgi:hypothetical protein